MIQKLYNFGLPFPKDKAIINSRKLTKIKIAIKQKIIKYALNDKYFINGVTREAPVINSISSYDLLSIFHNFSNILLKA
jgi:hypothetical protein